MVDNGGGSGNSFTYPRAFIIPTDHLVYIECIQNIGRCFLVQFHSWNIFTQMVLMKYFAQSFTDNVLCNKVLYVLSVFSIIWFFFLLYFHFQFIFNRLYLALLGCITCLEVCKLDWHRLSINIVIIGDYLYHMNHMHGWSHGWMHIICKKTVTKNSILVILH